MQDVCTTICFWNAEMHCFMLYFAILPLPILICMNSLHSFALKVWFSQFKVVYKDKCAVDLAVFMLKDFD
jgi:hypothetical protein